MKKVLITGAAGFAGRYMAEHLRSIGADAEVVGIDIAVPSATACDRFYAVDLSEADAVMGLLKEQTPDYVIHLAGTFAVDDVQQIYRINVLSATAILEAAKQYVPKAVVVLAGSAAEYGKVDSAEMPITEQAACRPVMPYGLSKCLATQVAQYYYRCHGLRTMIVRPFQLVGRGVTPRLAPGAFARRLVEAKQAGAKTIEVGNLESSRDFLDIHDAVGAIWMLCRHPAPGEIFNLCSGQPVKMAELLRIMVSACGGNIKPVTEDKYLRGTADVNAVYGSYKKIHQHCGWKPQMSLAESIQNMFQGTL